jgi:hypothetical protein
MGGIYQTGQEEVPSHDGLSAMPRMSDETPTELARTALKNQAPTRPRKPPDAI